MSKLLPMIIAFGLAVAFTAPAVAGTGPVGSPTSQRACEKAKMKWDAAQQKCCTTQTSSGRCM
jgi:hypothetical protein